MPTPAYVLLGNPLSLVCGRGLHSNPEASIRWLDTNGTAIMDNAHYDLENGTAIVRLNFTRTIASDNGMWTCEVVVRSERYIVDSEGELVRGGLAVIGNILRHRFIVTVIGKQSKCVTMTMLPILFHSSSRSATLTWIGKRWCYLGSYLLGASI